MTRKKSKKKQKNLSKIDGTYYTESDMNYTIQTFNGKKRKFHLKTKFVCPEKMF